MTPLLVRESISHMDRYSPEYKRLIVQRVLENPVHSVDLVASEMKVSRASLFRWLKTYGPSQVGIERRMIKPSEWSTAQRLRALLECQHLNETELGEYLRKHGLYYGDLVAWKAEILDEVKKNKKANSIPSSEASYIRRIRQLEKELKMKEKALLEATAILAMKKKAESIWPEEEEEKLHEKTEKNVSNSSKKP